MKGCGRQIKVGENVNFVYVRRGEADRVVHYTIPPKWKQVQCTSSCLELETGHNKRLCDACIIKLGYKW